MDNLKKKVMDILAIVKECPENLQQACFEILLKHELQQGTVNSAPKGPQKNEIPGVPDPIDQAEKTQQDISDTDIHVKVRRFLEKQALSIDDLNLIFYKEDDTFLPLYDDLRTTRTSESQIRIALLQCLLHALKTGDFSTDVEQIRSEATDRKCYDKNNFANNFTNNSGLFDFEKYNKDVKSINLSEQGKAELAKVIKEIE